MTRTHTHDCHRCGAPIACSGDPDYDYDPPQCRDEILAPAPPECADCHGISWCDHCGEVEAHSGGLCPGCHTEDDDA
jgi:hypothetical protein